MLFIWVLTMITRGDLTMDFTIRKKKHNVISPANKNEISASTIGVY
jgi:hypothetical protein